MRRQYYFLMQIAILLLAGCGASRPVGSGVCDCHQAVRVPDKAFRAFLVDKGYAVKAGWHKLMPTAEGCALTAMECYEKNIHSLQGIEMFPQLEQVTCSDNPLTELDLNALPHLQRLYGLNLPLRRINIDSCHHLQHIELSYTQLDTFNLAPFPELDFFFCIFSPLRNIDLRPCPLLRSLYIRGTQIRSVDISPCPVFWQIHALDSPLQRLIVSQEQYSSDKLKISVADTVKVLVN